jgi:hypothetical protein
VLTPSRVEATLSKCICTRGWCQSKVNLAEEAFARPFNFQTIEGDKPMELATKYGKRCKTAKKSNPEEQTSKTSTKERP